MDRTISVVILLIVIFNVTSGYKWQQVKQGSELPKNAIRLSDSDSSYVGRVVQYNLILPAKVSNSSYAFAFNPYTKTQITTKQFEILTASEKCHWIYFKDFSEVPENVVRVGRAWNREPIYLGRVDERQIASVLMASKQVLPESRGYNYALACENNATWFDATPPAIPRKAIVIKKNNFVARLVGPLSFIPAQIRNDSYFCSAYFDKITINSLSCQVLIGTSDKEYTWQSPGEFECIPENAVVVGRTQSDEFIYIIIDDFKSFKSVTFSEVVSTTFIYKVLIRNTY